MKPVTLNFNNKKGTELHITQEDMIKLMNNPHFHTVMGWVEKSLQITKMLVSPEFFHPSFTEKQRKQVVTMIYTIYPNVTDIQMMGDNGCIIKQDDYLDIKETEKKMDAFFKRAHQKAKRGSNNIKPKNRRKRK